LDYCFAAEDDVGCTDYLGTPRDFVACVLEQGRWLALREKGVGREEEKGRRWKDIRSRCIRLSLAFWTWLLHVRVDGELSIGIALIFKHEIQL
jgi:hypothetical protein